MVRRPPKSTRTDTLFPYTTLFRSLVLDAKVARRLADRAGPHLVRQPGGGDVRRERESALQRDRPAILAVIIPGAPVADGNGFVLDLGIGDRKSTRLNSSH